MNKKIFLCNKNQHKIYFNSNSINKKKNYKKKNLKINNNKFKFINSTNKIKKKILIN